MTLMRRRLDQDGVQDDHRRDGQEVQDVNDAVPVGAVIDSVLVLHDDHVEGVESSRRGDNTGRLPVHEVKDDVNIGERIGTLENSDNARVVAGEFDPRPEGRSEGGQPALRRGIAAQETKRRRQQHNLQVRAFPSDEGNCCRDGKNSSVDGATRHDRQQVRPESTVTPAASSTRRSPRHRAASARPPPTRRIPRG
jgi:hypothetical protein